MLDIIVAHYNEPWATGRKFFDMLGCQRGINFGSIHVILVHDGTEAYRQSLFSRYPYQVTQYAIPHGGVSKARNYGLSKATTEWIQFCDFDDMYAHAYALKQVMSVMDQDADYMWTPFMAEHIRDGETVVKTYENENMIFVHGKYFRRRWLIENGIFFPEGIHYSEDSAFCAIVNELAHRRGKIKTDFPTYIWCWRKDSVSVNPENDEQNMTGFIERNFWVVEEFKRRGIPHQLMVGRMFCDAYFAFHRADRKFPERERMFSERAAQYMDDLNQNTDMDMGKVYLAAQNAAKGRQTDYSETLGQWLNRIANGQAIAI